MFQKNSSSSLQQSITRIKFINWDWQYYSRARKHFQENPTAGLPEVSILIDSVISKRQGERRKHSFLERKKILHIRENGFIMSTHNITSLDGSSYEAIHSSIPQNIFSYLKVFNMQCRKIITVEDNKKRINITNFINIHTNIYAYIICDKNNTKCKWFNKLLLLTIIIVFYFLLQDFHIWSVLQIVEMEGSYHLLHYNN